MKNKKWINSEIKLPKPRTDVLVYDYDYMEVQHYIPPERNCSFGWYPGGGAIDGTYWMPLPNKPKIKTKSLRILKINKIKKEI